jgi:putative membrane protein
LAVAGYLEWRRNQRALRRGQPLPRSPLPRILATAITAMAVIATVLVLLSAALK